MLTAWAIASLPEKVVQYTSQRHVYLSARCAVRGARTRCTEAPSLCSASAPHALPLHHLCGAARLRQGSGRVFRGIGSWV